MKKFKFKKSVIGLTLVLSSFTAANAQWSVHEVNSNAIKSTLKETLDGIKTQITNQDAFQASMGIASRQQSVQLEETDRRNRSNASLADTLKRDRDAMPTLKQCVDLSRGKGSAGGGSKNVRAGGGGKSQTELNLIKDLATREYSGVKDLKSASACIGTEMDFESSFCPSSPSENKYAGAVISPRSLLGNIKDSKERNFQNYTLDKDAQKAALEYMKTATISNAPPILNKDSIKNNKYYLSSYHKVVNGLQTSFDAMHAVSSVYFEIDEVNGAVASLNTYWETVAPVFEALGMTPPPKPSLADVYFAEVNQDYYMLKKDRADDTGGEVENLREMNRKLSLNNFLTLRQIQLAEYQTILLSQLSAQTHIPEATRLTEEARNLTATRKTP